MTKNQSTIAPEISAISAIHEALSSLDPAAQMRVLKYVAEMLNLKFDTGATSRRIDHNEDNPTDQNASDSTAIASDTEQSGDTEGINAIALKWMKRSGLDPASLQPFFSLGIDEIDLVAKSVPGSGKKERMKSVLLLKGIAAYLGTGVPRVTHEQLKEACIHYDAYDSTNFASYLKSFAAEAGGSKSSG
ncbi:MAG TPA: hypothetical protein VGC86_15990, partial [Afipia sp.]